MPGEHDDFYKRLRSKVRKWARSKEGRRSEYAEYVLLAPDLFHLLVRLSLDKEVAVREKAKMGVAIAYFLSPIDLLPEWLVGPIGFLDDVGLAVYVLHSVIEHTDRAVIERHWAGDADLFETIRTFMTKADQMLGAGLWGKIQGLVDPGAKKRRPKPKTAKPSRSTAARATERVTGTTEHARAGGPDATMDEVAPSPRKRPAKRAAKKTGAKRPAKGATAKRGKGSEPVDAAKE